MGWQGLRLEALRSLFIEPIQIDDELRALHINGRHRTALERAVAEAGGRLPIRQDRDRSRGLVLGEDGAVLDPEPVLSGNDPTLVADLALVGRERLATSQLADPTLEPLAQPVAYDRGGLSDQMDLAWTRIHPEAVTSVLTRYLTDGTRPGNLPDIEWTPALPLT